MLQTTAQGLQWEQVASLMLPLQPDEQQWCDSLQSTLELAAASLIFYLQADTPLLNLPLTLKMLHNHQLYRADYSFADGYPEGLVPDIITAAALAQLRQLAQPQAFDYLGPRRILQRDINSLAVENLVADPSIRLLRAELRCNNPPNQLLLERALNWGASAERSPLDYIGQFPEQLRTLPAAIQLQLCHPLQTFCAYAPPAGGRSQLSPQLWKKIVLELQQLNPNAVLVLSEIGEAAEHPQVLALLGWLLEHSTLKVVVETAGTKWILTELLPLLQQASDRISWIVCLDSMDALTYRSLRGEGLAQALELIKLLQQHCPQQLYLQAVRLQDNAEQLPTFYRHWQQQGVQVIIQKYNPFAGLLPARQPLPLSPPLPRLACLRLRRELAIDPEGQVYLCLVDLVQQKHLLADLKQHSLEYAWLVGQPYYQQHQHHELPLPCQDCDEYYVWNF